MAKRPLPSPEVLRQLLSYDRGTGLITYNERPVSFFESTKGRSAADTCFLWNKRFAGKPAFRTVMDDGYLRTTILYRQIVAHRTAWAIHYGQWPDKPIDHLDGDRSNNSLANLRLVTTKINCRNRTLKSKANGLPRGVRLDKRKRPGTRVFRADVGLDGKMHCLGYFETPSEAHGAYAAAARAQGFTDRHIGDETDWPQDTTEQHKPARRAQRGAEG